MNDVPDQLRRYFDHHSRATTMDALSMGTHADIPTRQAVGRRRRSALAAAFASVAVLLVALGAIAFGRTRDGDSTHLDTSDAPATASQLTEPTWFVSPSPTMLADDRTFCLSFSDYLNTFVGGSSPVGTGTVADMHERFNEVVLESPEELRVDMQVAAGTPEGKQPSAAQVAAFDRIDSWLAAHCGFTMSGREANAAPANGNARVSTTSTSPR